MNGWMYETENVRLSVALITVIWLAFWPPQALMCLFCCFQLSVDTLKFLLFLYIQQLNRVSLRASLIGEGWPNRTRSPSPSDREAKTSMQNKVLHPANEAFGEFLKAWFKKNYNFANVRSETGSTQGCIPCKKSLFSLISFKKSLF